MNFGNFPKAHALNELRIVIISIIFRSFFRYFTEQRGGETSQTWKADVNLRIRIMCPLHVKHGFKPTDEGHSPTEGTQASTWSQV